MTTQTVQKNKPDGNRSGSASGFCIQERPIIFSAPMIRAILDGRKTQTRRIVKPTPAWVGDPAVPFKTQDADPKGIIKCPYGEPGDMLYVRECFRQAYARTEYSDGIIYRADQCRSAGMHEFSDCHKWKPSIHMPKKYARIWLKVEDIRVQPVQEISEQDSIAEGCPPLSWDSMQEQETAPSDWFRHLWDEINEDRGFGWGANPWVWAVDFSVVSTTGRKAVSA